MGDSFESISRGNAFGERSVGDARESRLRLLQRMDPYQFEHLVADVWAEMGWETHVSSASNDGGVDVTARRSFPYERKVLIQAKRYGPNTTVGSPDVQQYSSLENQRDGVDDAVIVTTNGFSRQAEAMAETLNVKCVDGERFLEIVDRVEADHVLEEYLPELREPESGLGETTGADRDGSEPVTESAEATATRGRVEAFRDETGFVDRFRAAPRGTKLVGAGAALHLVGLGLPELAVLGMFVVTAGILLEAYDRDDWRRRGYAYAVAGWMPVLGGIAAALYVYRRLSD
jgi:restriction system protein